MLRPQAIRIFRAALKAADPEHAVLRFLKLEDGVLIAGNRKYPLTRFDRIQVVGAGKAGAAMARAVERLLGPRITGGLINVQDGNLLPLRRIELNESGHPMPDERGMQGARRIAQIARDAGPRDLLLCLISGGGSALMPLPVDGVTLAEKQQLTRQLLACGATIHEINAVRKHISQLKGGQLARLAYPATVISLILSDVIGDDLDVIASGPTVGDRSTFAVACGILEKYGIEPPASIAQRLSSSAPETPKPGDESLGRVQNLIVGSNREAVNAAAAAAKALGYRPLVLSTLIEGETREVAQVHAAIAKEVLATGRPARRPVCLLSGGETTVTLRGKGLGGRNQEFVLAAAMALEGCGPVTIFSGGTDGKDGPTDAAGAIADETTAARARALGHDPRAFLAANDSYHFFEHLGDLIKTGPSGTNVMDVRFILLPNPKP